MQIDHLCWLVEDPALDRAAGPPSLPGAHDDVGPETLAAEAAGGGLFAWAVLVEDLEGIAHRHGLEVDDYTLEQPDGTLRGWRTATGPSHLPFFIDYPNNGNRGERLAQLYERVQHTAAPARFSRLVVEGDADEMRDWLGPNDLPIECSAGSRGLVAADIETSGGLVRVPGSLSGSRPARRSPSLPPRPLQGSS